MCGRCSTLRLALLAVVLSLPNACQTQQPLLCSSWCKSPTKAPPRLAWYAVQLGFAKRKEGFDFAACEVTVGQPVPAAGSSSVHCQHTAGAAVAYQVAIECELVVQDLICLDLNISSLTLCATQRLMDHDATVGQAVALALESVTHDTTRHDTARMTQAITTVSNGRQGCAFAAGPASKQRHIDGA